MITFSRQFLFWSISWLPLNIRRHRTRVWSILTCYQALHFGKISSYLRNSPVHVFTLWCSLILDHSTIHLYTSSSRGIVFFSLLVLNVTTTCWTRVEITWHKSWYSNAENHSILVNSVVFSRGKIRQIVLLRSSEVACSRFHCMIVNSITAFASLRMKAKSRAFIIVYVKCNVAGSWSLLI